VETGKGKEALCWLMYLKRAWRVRLRATMSSMYPVRTSLSRGFASLSLCGSEVREDGRFLPHVCTALKNFIHNLGLVIVDENDLREMAITRP
jgi:hypothetical protein